MPRLDQGLHEFKEESQNDLGYNYYRQPQKRKYSRDEPQDVAAYASEMLDNPKYKIGDWVLHDTFGKGQILGVENSNAGTKLSIFFGTKGLKKIVAEYANLQVLD